MHPSPRGEQSNPFLALDLTQHLSCSTWNSGRVPTSSSESFQNLVELWMLRAPLGSRVASRAERRRARGIIIIRRASGAVRVDPAVTDLSESEGSFPLPDPRAKFARASHPDQNHTYSPPQPFRRPSFGFRKALEEPCGLVFCLAQIQHSASHTRSRCGRSGYLRPS
jgi:hypothetical protein